MASEQGFSNQKKKGKAQFKTIHPVNSDGFAESVISKYLAEVSAATLVDVASVTDIVGSNGQVEFWEIEFGSSHLAIPGDVIRFKSVVDPSLFNFEFDVISVSTAEILRVLPISSVQPSVGDLVSVRRWVTGSSDDDGNLVMSQGPVQFLKDSTVVQVSEDTINPFNTVALPVQDFQARDSLSQMNLRMAGSLVPSPYDEIITTYVGTTTDIDTVTYKFSGTVVATLTMTYDGSNRLISVVRT